jgi:hypothetical protein
MTIQQKIIISKQMYYNKYECEFGDGFYPQLSFVIGNSYTSICFQFIQERNAWKQIDNLAITGLDPPYGKELLTVLNSESGFNASHIENIWNKVINKK